MKTVTQVQAIKDPLLRARHAKDAAVELEERALVYRQVLDTAVGEALAAGVRQAEVARQLGVTRNAINKKHGNGSRT